MSHVQQKFVGRNRIDYQDVTGVFVTQELLQIAKSGQGFFSYIASIEPSTGKPSRKRSFVIAGRDYESVLII